MQLEKDIENGHDCIHKALFMNIIHEVDLIVTSLGISSGKIWRNIFGTLSDVVVECAGADRCYAVLNSL